MEQVKKERQKVWFTSDLHFSHSSILYFHPKRREHFGITLEELQKTRKCYLVKIEGDKKIPLTNEEIEIFKKEHEDVYKLLVDEEEREKLKENSDKSLLYFESWEKQAKKLINLLWKVKGAYLFHKPVDPVELGIPDYFQVIKNPMDFSTIKKKLSNNLYTNFKQFNEDIKLTFDNILL